MVILICIETLGVKKCDPALYYLVESDTLKIRAYIHTLFVWKEIIARKQ